MRQTHEQLLDNYHDWHASRSRLRQASEVPQCSIITTPFVDAHHDCIELYVTTTGGSSVLSDDGAALSDYTQRGGDPARLLAQPAVREMLNGLQVTATAEGVLQTTSAGDDFPLQMTNLLQAVLALCHQPLVALPPAVTDHER